MGHRSLRVDYAEEKEEGVEEEECHDQDSHLQCRQVSMALRLGELIVIGRCQDQPAFLLLR